MRLLSLSALTLGGLALLLGIASPGVSRAAVHRGRSVPRGYAPMMYGLAVRRNAPETPTPCLTNFPSRSSTAVAGAGDVAGGDSSGVSAGNHNQACDADDGVAGGFENLVGDSSEGTPGDADYSSIGGGYGNVVTDAEFAFIGSGDANVNYGNASFIGGGYSNFVLADGADAFIGAGSNNGASGAYSFVGSGQYNAATADESAVAGGFGGYAAGAASFVGTGGYEYHANCSCNFLSNHAVGNDSFVGAGDQNDASGNGSFIGAGDYTYESVSGGKAAYGNTASGTDAFLGAGDQNTVAALEGFVGSGQLNDITSAASDAAIVGGNDNYASGLYAAVGGGSGNKVEGAFSVIPGGADNEALGSATFAAGYHAEAAHNGSFVWSDDSSGSSLVADSAVNQFVVRASGGTTIYSSETLASGVKLAAGSGTWASLSDRNAKTDVAPLDDASVLAKVATLPVNAWRYKTERGVRHVGPMAQDFYAAFGVGEDDRHITSIDEDGVALAAIKALHAENGALQRESGSLKNENGQLRRENARVESRLSLLEARDQRLERRLDVLAARVAR